MLSLRSNADNHPAVLGEPGRRRWCPDPKEPSPAIRLSAKTGLPVGFTGAANDRGGRDGGGGGVRAGSAAGATGGGFDCASVAGDSVASAARRRGESAEEKRERKAAVKDTRVRLLRLSQGLGFGLLA